MRLSNRGSAACLPPESLAGLARQEVARSLRAESAARSVRGSTRPRLAQESLARLERRRVARRLLLAVVALNLAGIACFALATQAQGSLANEAAEAVADPASALATIGFGLMLPGIFFASVTLLGAKVFAGNEQMAFGAWYVTGFALNLLAAWRAGEIFADTSAHAPRAAAEEQG